MTPEIDQVKDQRDDAIATLKSWFEVQSLAREQLVPEFVGCVKGYLRTSRNGGMPQEQSDMVENVLEDFADKYLVRALWPILLRIAEDNAAKLVVPAAAKPTPPITDERMLACIETALEGNKMTKNASDLTDDERAIFNITTKYAGALLFLQHMLSDRIRTA